MPTRVGIVPRAILALGLVVLLTGIVRATYGLALTQASHHRTSAGANSLEPSGGDAAAAPGENVKPLGTLRSADVLLTADRPIPSSVIGQVAHQPGVDATEPFRYGTVSLAGNNIPTYGVDPSTFRNWAAKITASSDPFWSSLAAGEASASFQTAKDLNLPLGAQLPFTAHGTQTMKLGSFATVGLPDAELVLSEQRAAALGLPASSGLLVSAPKADLRQLIDSLQKISGDSVAVRPLKQLPPDPSTTSNSPLPQNLAGSTDGLGFPSDPGAISGGSSVPAASSASAQRVIGIAQSKIGAPYVYGASGPNSFDCSGFVQWVFAQVGINLPRTAQEQWLAGPHVSYADAQPGDILAWAGDPSDPGYATHVAIYLGNGQMISAPHSGTTVSVSSVYTSGLLGAVRVLR